MEEESSQERKESFIGQGDRPEVRLDPNMPISELRVRDLASILSRAIYKPIIKELKYEKFEKHEKFEIKELKPEKFEKNEKLEWEKLDKHPGFEQPFDPGSFPDPLPWQQLAEVVKGLSQKVDQLADQVAELQKRG